MDKKRHCGEAKKGSRYHLQRYVNNRQQELNRLIMEVSPSLKEFAARKPRWVSPVKDDYCEYQDREFLEKLDLGDHWQALKKFWPKNGPVWDGLAKIRGKNETNGAIILEAKSHTGELTSKCGAKGDSRARICDSLRAVQRALGGEESKHWINTYYQYANRLAHLYFLNQERGVPTWLVFLYFLGDEAWKSAPKNASEWQDTLGDVKKKLALPDHHLLHDRIITTFAPATEYA